jgi:hypothetical protein
MRKLEIATGFAHYKVLLAILGVLTAWASFEVWKWQQQQHEKYLLAKQQACQDSLDSAEKYVKSDRFLKSAYYSILAQKPLKIKLNQPGINTNFEVGKRYILMPSQPVSLIPENPRYEGGLFERLARKPSKASPEPLMVTGQKILGNKAEVVSVCSPNPFTVSLEHLYETVQPIDVSPYLSPFSIF